MEKLGKDPIVKVLKDKPDLHAILERLAAREAKG